MVIIVCTPFLLGVGGGVGPPTEFSKEGAEAEAWQDPNF